MSNSQGSRQGEPLVRAAQTRRRAPGGFHSSLQEAHSTAAAAVLATAALDDDDHNDATGVAAVDGKARTKRAAPFERRKDPDTEFGEKRGRGVWAQTIAIKTRARMSRRINAVTQPCVFPLTRLNEPSEQWGRHLAS